MKDLLDSHALVLMEAAIVERLRRGGEVELHVTLTNAPLIYDEMEPVLVRKGVWI